MQESVHRPFYTRIPLMTSVVRRVHKKLQMHAFKKEFEAFQKLTTSAGPRFELDWDKHYACLDDRTSDTPFDHHYVLHTAWAARVLVHTKPARHIDISSNLFFVAACSAVTPIDFYDFRPADLKLDNLHCHQGDLTKLPFADASVASISCMHVVEHVGLGRYGDPLDADGDLKAMRELARVVSVGGHLLFVVPVGASSIVFNAHRIYSYEQVIGAFPNFIVRDCVLIPDVNTGTWIANPTPQQVSAQKYGCGCFWFERRA